jgi:putative ABC transport system ATP-binding protein
MFMVASKKSCNKDIKIKLNDVKKVYLTGKIKFEALKGINLKVRSGEFLLIQGPSGSGKSTLMNMIGCLDVPTSGVINLCGYNIAKLPESDLAQIRGKVIGFIFQKFNLISNLTALENVMLPMAFQNVDIVKREIMAKKYLDLVGLKGKYNNKPGELSGGQQQRVAIARSLSNNPDIILGDEPTGNLDTKTSKTILELLKDLQIKENKTIIIVTHDPSLEQYADRVIHIVDGLVTERVLVK